MEFMNCKGADLPVSDEVDVLVCGGGSAGLAAAINASRKGAKTLIVERASCLGGTATAGMMAIIGMDPVHAHGFSKEFYTKIAKDRFSKSNPSAVPFSIEHYKYVAQKMVLESDARLLYYTWISDVILEENKIVGVVIDNKSGRSVIKAKVVIDGTGDADIAYYAGVPCVKGREEDGKMRPMTVLGFFDNVNLRKLKEYVDAHPEDMSADPVRRLTDADIGIFHTDGYFSIPIKAQGKGLMRKDSKLGCINYLRFSTREEIDIEHALVNVNCTRIYDVDGTNAYDLTDAEIEGRIQLNEVYETVKSLVPGFEKSRMVESSPWIGVRETRRIKGQYIMPIEDIEQKKHYDDNVTILTSNAYARAEVHGPDKGFEGSENDFWARKLVMTEIGHGHSKVDYELPLRCMLTNEIENLIVVGRCISVTHQVDVYTRVMYNTTLMGQVAGVYSALKAKGEYTIQKLQSILEKDGVRLQRIDY